MSVAATGTSIGAEPDRIPSGSGWRLRAGSLALRAMAALSGEGVAAVLFRGASSALLVNVIGTGCGFVMQLLLARLLGAAVYGQYIYAFCWMSLLVLFGKLGLDTLTLRYVSAYSGQADWPHLRGFLRASRGLALGASLATATIVAGIVWWISPRLDPSLVAALGMGCLLLPIWVAMQVFAAGLTAQRRILAAQAPQAIGRPVVLMALVAGTITAGFAVPSASLVMGLHVLASAAMLAVLAARFRRGLPGELHAAAPVYAWREWGRVLIPFTLLAALEVLDEQADVLITGSLVSTQDAGVYAVVSRLSLLITFGFTAVNAIAAPLIASLYAQRQMQELQRMVTLAARGVLAFSLPVSLLLIVFGREVLAWFGPEFTPGYWPLVVMTSAQIVTAVVGPVGFLLTMTGHQHDAFRVRVLSCLAGIALNLTLIPLYGILGAAITMTLMTCAWKLGMLWCVVKRLGINPTVLPYLCRRREER